MAIFRAPVRMPNEFPFCLDHQVNREAIVTPEPADPIRFGLASDEARDFIDRAPPLPLEPISLDNIARRRADALATFSPASERAIVRHRVAVNEIVIGGIACQEVLARGLEAKAGSATILYFFGGGYAQGSPFEELPITATLSRLTGARILVPYYRLAPEHPYPAAIEDGMSVYRSLARDESVAALALAGESAGGNLALVAMAKARAEGLRMPCVAALLSPWTDLANTGDSAFSNATRDPTLDPLMVEDYARAYVAGADRTDPGISPLRCTFDRSWPPTIVTTGTRDLLLSQSVRLAQRMCRSGIEVDLRIWDGLWHVFEFYDTLPEAALSLAEIAAFMNAGLENRSRISEAGK